MHASQFLLLSRGLLSLVLWLYLMVISQCSWIVQSQSSLPSFLMFEGSTSLMLSSGPDILWLIGFLFFFLKIYVILCVWAFPRLCALHGACCPEENISSPGPGVTDGCDPLHRCWEQNPGHLQGQQLMLTIDPSLLTPGESTFNVFFLLCFKILLTEIFISFWVSPMISISLLNVSSTLLTFFFCKLLTFFSRS